MLFAYFKALRFWHLPLVDIYICVVWLSGVVVSITHASACVASGKNTSVHTYVTSIVAANRGGGLTSQCSFVESNIFC